MIKQGLILLGLLLIIGACQKNAGKSPDNTTQTMMSDQKKIVVYQVFTRLFGNTNSANIPWGTLEENGVGKFEDFNEKALKEIRDLGITHIWYTGVPHHALVTDYSEYGISQDDPDVIKGRAGSPYAVKDYYNVNPDLAVNPAERMQEFEALIARTHAQQMKVIIDIVPNHVARNYEGSSTPEGYEPFGAQDDKSVEYRRDNNFYYIPGSAFQVPNWAEGYQPLGGGSHPLLNQKYTEDPAKWTGNGSRSAQPHIHDWYETVKVNYGVAPDGTYDFERLPEGYENLPWEAHFQFWEGKDVPDSWIKFREITTFWLEKGIDGFRYDMAEMVPVEFWSYLNSGIKKINPEAFLLAEVYNPALYRDYLFKGKMDYLYDKVEFYDSLKHVMQGHGWTDHLAVVQNGLQDIEHHMLHFLENHDEQRIASPEFAGDARKGIPAMVVSATISTSPTMLYFGQELGEPGAEDAGYGKPSRTSIFDYIGVPHLQRWVNNKKYDGGASTEEELALRDFYKRLLNFVKDSEGLTGDYREIHFYNKEHTPGYDHRLFSFVRWSADERLIVVANFETDRGVNLDLKLPPEVVETWGLNEAPVELKEMIYDKIPYTMTIENKMGEIPLELPPLSAVILKID